ncbi:MAG: NAD(P)H-dependent glycerol-3-phosphate dehydrogenase [Marinibacterium sp.]
MIGIVGGGAFGTALAVALGEDHKVVLWTRSPDRAARMHAQRRNDAFLPGITLPSGINVTSDLADLGSCDTVLLSVPMQHLRAVLIANQDVLTGVNLVACCKGIELDTGLGPHQVIADVLPTTPVALLTGPSFAMDIARGLPTALTLAGGGAALQARLSTPVLRLYHTMDLNGAAIGGALKNVIAIACGAAIGAGLGESARAALMTRGYAEMQRYALAHGARAQTLAGLSGFGDLALTCTSPASRNFRLGLAIGGGEEFESGQTVEGAATARAVAQVADRRELDMPITRAVVALIDKTGTVASVMDALLSRPLKEE